MIQVTIRDDDPILQLIDARVSHSGRNKGDVADELIHESFVALVRAWHAKFMDGEISQGAMAEQLGIGRSDLIHILEGLDLQVTNL